MAKLRMVRPSLRTIDTRAVRPSPKKADAELLTAEHRTWREQVLRNAGYRCEAMVDGQRCTKASPEQRMFADHIIERRDGGAPLDPRNGQCLCGAHHTAKTAAARRTRVLDQL